jgi:hypothetical protein
VDIRGYPGGCEFRAQLLRIAASRELGRLPVLRVTKEELDSVGTEGRRELERIAVVEMGTDDGHPPSLARRSDAAS